MREKLQELVGSWVIATIAEPEDTGTIEYEGRTLPCEFRQFTIAPDISALVTTYDNIAQPAATILMARSSRPRWLVQLTLADYKLSFHQVVNADAFYAWYEAWQDTSELLTTGKAVPASWLSFPDETPGS